MLLGERFLRYSFQYSLSTLDVDDLHLYCEYAAKDETPLTVRHDNKPLFVRHDGSLGLVEHTPPSQALAATVDIQGDT